MKKIPQSEVFLIVLAAFCGGLSGAVVSFALHPYLSETPEPALHVTSTTPIEPVATGTLPVISLINVGRSTPTSLVPPAILKRRSSSLATVYRKPKGTALEDRMLGDDRLLGHAVALTSDGWFATSPSVFEGVRLADAVLYQNGRAYPIERGVIDHLTNTAFVKTSANGLNAPAFVPGSEVSFGTEVWTETRPDGYAPHVVLDHRVRLAPNDAASSEVASRRYVLNGQSSADEAGSAAWDSNGALIGLIESKAGEDVRVIPASAIANSFSSLLENGDIRHAVLGVHAIDLGVAHFDGARGDLPEQGAIIRGVLRADSPAAKAKLKTGDVILRVERDILDGSADLGETLAEYRPNEAVTLRILRGTSDSDVQVTLGAAVTSEPLK